MNLRWDEFRKLSPKEMAPHLTFGRDGRIQRLVYAQQLTRPIIEDLISLAEFIRTSDQSQRQYMRRILAARSCVLYFPQCSTRTFTSFSLAAQSLGMMVEEIRDPELSAMYKGESEIDTLLTLATLSDLVVLRQMDSKLTDQFVYELLKRQLPTCIVNGGSGSDQHPTQALLELYTLNSHLDFLTNDRPISVAFVGDLSRSRTARSLSYLLALYPQVKHTFVAPKELQMGSDLLGYLQERSIEFTLTDSLDETIPTADAFYMMRIQDEYSTTSEEVRENYNHYHLTVKNVNAMKTSACIIHPLPRRAEIPVEIDDNPRAKYWEAVRRGKYIRIALLLHMFDCADLEKLRAGTVNDRS
jgi:aspartate carbamoyltransferase catalytic subunit